MRLIIGLGNPDKKYKNTRHNVGFLIVDWLRSNIYSNCYWRKNNKFEAVVCGPKAVNIILAKPQTYVNQSGRAVKKIVDFYKISLDDLYVIHDDLDIPFGKFKIQKGCGPKVHKGIQSIEKSLGGNDFWRIRVGVDNRNPENRIPGEIYVLQDFTKKEQQKLKQTFVKIIKELDLA